MVYLIKLAFRNVGRNKRRTLLTASAIGFSVMIIGFGFCYLSGVIDTIFESYIRLEAGHLKIYAEGYQRKERLLPLDLSVDLDKIQTSLSGLDGIRMITGRIRFGAMIDAEGRNETAVGMGLDFGGEKNLLRPADYLKKGRVPDPDGEVILLGYRLAENLGVGVGDTVTLLSQTAYHSLTAMNFRVSGLFETGFKYVDESTFYVPLRAAQVLLDMAGSVTEVVFLLENRDQSQVLGWSVEERLGSTAYEIVPWQEQGDLVSAMMTSRSTMFLVYGIILFIAGLTILNTMLMSVLERTREIGMMMAMGMRGREVVRLFFLEALVIGTLGGIVGGVLAGVGAGVTQKTGIALGEAVEGLSLPIGNVIYPQFSLVVLLQAFFFGMVVASLASLYPAFIASRMEVTEVLRR